MRTITLEELLEAGCHFGHQVSRQNPKTREFVFEARDNIHIIDLEKTKEGLEKAAVFIRDTAQKPDSSIIILGTKRQAEGIVREEVKRAADTGASNIYSVITRWIGGTFTNFAEVTKNYKKLKDLTERLKNEFEKAKYTKKEISLWEKERVKLETYYGGIKDMTKVPDVLFVIDTHLERLAVKEAQDMGVPVVGIVDTNADPDPVTYPIPANDDATGSIKLIVSYILDAWIEGKKKAAKGTEEKNEQKETSDTKTGDKKVTAPESKTQKAESAKESKKITGEKKSTKVKTEKSKVKNPNKK